MRILIIGAGVVGTHLAEQLSHEGHDISLLDKNAELVAALKEKLDVLSVYGDAICPADLLAAKIQEAEMVIAVTNDDARNILVCQIANKFNVTRKIARVRSRAITNPNFPLAASELGIDILINPETVTVETIKKTMEVPGATEVADFAGGDILLCGFHLSDSTPVVGIQLNRLKESDPAAPFLLVAIVRNGKVIIPKGNETLKSKDHIFVLMEQSYASKFLKLIDKAHNGKLKKVVILSASPLAQYLSTELESSIEKVVLIEKDLDIAHEASTKLTSHVMHGEMTDPEVLRMVGMENADYFLALSEDEEANILCALVAKKHGAQQVITLQHTDRYESLINYLDIDVIVNPKQLTAGEILKYVRKGRIHAVTKLQESEAEVIELEAIADAPIVGSPLKSVAMPSGALVGAILREGKMLIPTGSSIIGAGERVIVFALPEAIEKIERLFGSP